MAGFDIRSPASFIPVATLDENILETRHDVSSKSLYSLIRPVLQHILYEQ